MGELLNRLENAAQHHLDNQQEAKERFCSVAATAASISMQGAAAAAVIGEGVEFVSSEVNPFGLALRTSGLVAATAGPGIAVSTGADCVAGQAFETISNTTKKILD